MSSVSEVRELGWAQSSKLSGAPSVLVRAAEGLCRKWTPLFGKKRRRWMQQPAVGPDQMSGLRPQASARPGAAEVPGLPCRPPSPTDLPGEPGASVVCSLHHRQHLLWSARRALRDSGGGCPEGQCPRLHHGAPGRLQYRYRAQSITSTVPGGPSSGIQPSELCVALCQLLFIISGEIHVT